MTLKFAPPPAPSVPEWATYVWDRHPKFKVHSEKRYADAAVKRKSPWSWDKEILRGGIIYHLENGEWVEVERIPGRGLGE